MNRPGFRRVLLAVADAYKNKRDELVRTAESLADAVTKAEGFNGARGEFNLRSSTSRSARSRNYSISATADSAARRNFRTPRLSTWFWSVTGRPEKSICWRWRKRRSRKWPKAACTTSLPVGFHRYSVDERWLVPHFEKMSYDNSELLKNYLHGGKSARNPLWESALPTRRASYWVNEVLSDQEHGGFYGSQDADDSLDDDGDYFTWTLDEFTARSHAR